MKHKLKKELYKTKTKYVIDSISSYIICNPHKYIIIEYKIFNNVKLIVLVFIYTNKACPP